MTKSNNAFEAVKSLEVIERKLLEKYFQLHEIYNELGSVLCELEDVKESIKHKYELIERRQELREEEMQTIVDLLESIGFDTNILP